MEISNNELESFQKKGYLIISDVFTDEEILCLQSESDALLKYYELPDTSRDLESTGCVADVFYDVEIKEECRINCKEYLKIRFKELDRIKDTLQESKNSSEHINLIEKILFQKLAQIVSILFTRVFKKEHSTYLFNEHYVVKLPHSNIEFRWHRDDEEQLAMCLTRPTLPYISAWCPLDDITASNGGLVIYPLSQDKKIDNPDELRNIPLQTILLRAKSVIFFLSNVWHCSPPNDSNITRRVFYAQYSGEIIYSTPSTKEPLSFAIPCDNKVTNKRHLEKKSAFIGNTKKKRRFME